MQSQNWAIFCFGFVCISIGSLEIRNNAKIYRQNIVGGLCGCWMPTTCFICMRLSFIFFYYYKLICVCVCVRLHLSLSLYAFCVNACKQINFDGLNPKKEELLICEQKRVSSFNGVPLISRWTHTHTHTNYQAQCASRVLYPKSNMLLHKSVCCTHALIHRFVSSLLQCLMSLHCSNFPLCAVSCSDFLSLHTLYYSTQYFVTLIIQFIQLLWALRAM